mmetsp:Transcript_32928/g.86196  ORF Transcript_32928/g.86196 Transcript_32928/m.86196 type:complete len:361 (-) Transcript_32928:477-1559(-)
MLPSAGSAPRRRGHTTPTALVRIAFSVRHSRWLIRSALSVHDWLEYPTVNIKFGTFDTMQLLNSMASAATYLRSVVRKGWRARAHTWGWGCGGHERGSIDNYLHRRHWEIVLQCEPGGGDDHVRRDLVAAVHCDARLGDRLDGPRHHIHLARPYRRKKVPVGHQADSLVPRVVPRVEVGVDIKRRRQLPAGGLHQRPPGGPGEGPGEPVVEARLEDHVPVEDGVGPRRREHRLCGPLHRPRHGLPLGRPGHKVGWGPLHHGDPVGRLRQRRDHRGRGGPRPDHRDAGPVARRGVPLGPLLGVHHPPREPCQSGDRRAVRRLVRVVPGGQVEEAADVHPGGGGEGPPLLLGRPLCRPHLGA